MKQKDVEREIRKLISYEVVETSRNVGRTKMYRLNIKESISSILNSLISEIARIDYEGDG